MHCLGLDIGFGEIKAVYRDETGEIQYIICPSIYARARRNPLASSDNIITVAGQDYYVGEEARKEITQISPADFKDILECTAIFAAFVKQEMGVSENITAVGSVPPDDWQRMNEYRRQLEQNFGATSAVAPQGLGAIETVRDRISIGGRTLVLDIGYNTVDHLVVDRREDGELYPVDGGTWRDSGITLLVDIFQSEIGDTELSKQRFHQLKEFLRDGKASLHRGGDIDLSGPKRRAIEHYREAISSRIKEELSGKAKLFDTMVCCGGGMHYMGEMDGFFGGLPVIMAPRVEFANAIGQMLIAEKYETEASRI